ncbi:MAG: RNase adapter RapZ, partial [Acutalibacteraceae bacterium]|nr:RNase adapter RapZ [Acutalibacteraceae bacterium]
MEFIIVTGYSGAGKSHAINALEDIGYYCIDNVPSNLMKNFAELISSGSQI